MRSRVLGRPQRPDETIPALLYGCERVYARGRRYPVLIRDLDGIVDGLLLPRLAARDWRRLRTYEGREYRLARVRVQPLGHGAKRAWAHVFLSYTLGATGRPWMAIGR